MKRPLLLLFTALLLSTVLCVSASASDFDAVAEDLSAIGMFRGTESGFELDRAPTRSEAAIMLVRLYGAEEAAKIAYEAGEINHPFTDVSAFTSPYVAWLYTNGITNGYTETTYASQQACTAQNYIVFLLRALGYKDNTDFVYADAPTFAAEKGFYNPLLFPGDFLRDDLAALTYQALAADMADGETYLLDSLLKSGAIDAEAAKPMTEKIETYRAFNTAASSLYDDAMSMDINVTMDVVIKAMGRRATSSIDMNSNIQIIMDDSDIQLAYDMRAMTNGSSVSTRIWMKDGWVYMYDETGSLWKYRTEDPAAVLEEIELDTIDTMDVSDLALIKSITSRKSGSDTVYTITISAFEDVMDEIFKLIDATEDMQFVIGDISLIYTLDDNGKLRASSLISDASVSASEKGTPYTIELRYTGDMAVNATGNQVKIAYPDLSSAREIFDENAM